MERDFYADMLVCSRIHFANIAATCLPAHQSTLLIALKRCRRVSRGAKEDQACTESVLKWLRTLRLDIFVQPLREDLGVTTIAQLHKLQNTDFKSIGMSEPQIERIMFKRHTQVELVTSETAEARPHFKRQNSAGLAVFQIGLDERANEKKER